MHVDVLTLFPEWFTPFLTSSIVGRAQTAGLASVACTNFRDFAEDRHHTVDDRPFGGGPGMLLLCGPLFRALESLEAKRPGPATRILLTPQGQRLDQAIAAELAREPWLIVLCGHYEGFDERVRDGIAPREISIGDYVLSGGEPAAMVLIDAVVRLIPGVLGHDESPIRESFTGDRLDYPQYTRPREFRGMKVPDVLLSGDHARIEAWRKEQALERTRQLRPDLLGPEPNSSGSDGACGARFVESRAGRRNA